jgi:hypothetical protein
MRNRMHKQKDEEDSETVAYFVRSSGVLGDHSGKASGGYLYRSEPDYRRARI